jgi:lipid-A-disaccharide synthase-like uncharacterized protein
LNHETWCWLAIGFAGQTLFSLRFLVQWLQSERRRKSVIPPVFWCFSVAGGVTLLAYALHKQDPVFIIGQSTGLFIYARNLYLIGRERPHAPANQQNSVDAAS